MSTSKIVDTRFAKILAIVNACVPAAILLWDAVHHNLGVNEVNYAIRTTGLIGLVCLVATLAITPLRKLTGWQTLIAIRRNLGVAGFIYISLHFLIFYWWDRDASITSTAHEIVTREYLWFGFGALVIMIPLAVTSTDAMVSRLGAKRWKQLHRLTYVVVLAGCVHYILLVKSDTRPPLAFTSVVVALLLFRAIGHEIDLRRELRAARGKLGLAKAVKKPAFWSGQLKIARIFQETHDVKTFRFVRPDGGPLPFEHVAGQYLNLSLTIDGKRVNRSYTIASSPTRQAYCEISVKRASYGSKHLHDTWREGDVVKVSAPAGRFFFAGHEAERVVLIAGGIGITPMMSVTRSLTDRGWKGDIYLVFSVRKRVDVVFEAELEYLKARHPNLHVLVTVTDDPEWTGARGRITADVLRGFVPDFAHGPVMLCGPDPMMTAMRAVLVGMGIPDAEIHQEAFVSPPPVAETASATDEDPPLPDGETATITFGKSGTTAQVTNATSILQAAEEAGVTIPFECRSGICGQCKTRLVHGKVRMDATDALTNHDRAKGLVLACQAHATRDCTVDA
jgi:ferredoxin-NADP reductase/DMSO/TMAO reductase YedYZ heme-binding membrane subunit